MWHKPCRTFNPWCLCIKTRCLSAKWSPFCLSLNVIMDLSGWFQLMVATPLYSSWRRMSIIKWGRTPTELESILSRAGPTFMGHFWRPSCWHLAGTLWWKRQSVVSLTFHKFSKIISWKYTKPEFTYMVRISSWNFIRVPKAWLWAHVQIFSLKFSCKIQILQYTSFREHFGELAKP